MKLTMYKNEKGICDILPFPKQNILYDSIKVLNIFLIPRLFKDLFLPG
jgi:hypothetical protein